MPTPPDTSTSSRLLLLLLLLLPLSAATSFAAIETTQGKLPDGTPYRIDMPEKWNGTLLVGLDYASNDPAQPRPSRPEFDALLERGYAMAGTSRTVTGWSIHLAAANAVKVLDIFSAKYGKPKHAVEYGSSMGGHTAALSAQAYPERWDGALPACGGLAGAVGQWQGKFDALFVARALLAPDADLPIVHVPPDWQKAALPAWQRMFEAAKQTPEGRARISLAAMIGQLPDWADPAKPRPSADDLDARQAGLMENLFASRMPLLNQAMSSRSQIERLSGGNITSNVAVDYARVLQQIDKEGLIAKLYARAGLRLADDLARLARAPRVSAEPAALAFMATGVFDGRLNIPVLTLNGIGDPISSVAGQQSYGAAVTAAGKEPMLRQLYTASAGHCGFTAAEHVTAVETLVTRLDTGTWPETTAVAMNKAAAASGLGESRFIQFTPPIFARPYTPCDLDRDLKAGKVTPVRAEGQALPACGK
jgi:hypothetical protein